MHLKTLFLAIVMSVLLTAPVFAMGKTCPPGQEKKGWKCVDIEVPDSGTTINNNNDNDNSNRNTNSNFNTNLNSLKNENAVDVKVKVENDVDVRNTNMNTNFVSNKQSQDQDQAQMQGQGQMQGQTAHNEGVEQKIVIKEAKIPVSYNHISPDVGKTDANAISHGGESDIRTLTSIFLHDDDNYITMPEATKASSGADIDVIKALLWEAKTQLDTLNYKDVSGKYMGSITLLTEDATLDQVLARAAKEAMFAGATSFEFIVRDAKQVSATKYGIDFGSSASVAAKADGSIIVAPGATLGWSKTKAQNIIVGEVYVALFRDESLIVE